MEATRRWRDHILPRWFCSARSTSNLYWAIRMPPACRRKMRPSCRQTLSKPCQSLHLTVARSVGASTITPRRKTAPRSQPRHREQRADIPSAPSTIGLASAGRSCG